MVKVSITEGLFQQAAAHRYAQMLAKPFQTARLTGALVLMAALKEVMRPWPLISGKYT